MRREMVDGAASMPRPVPRESRKVEAGNLRDRLIDVLNRASLRVASLSVPKLLARIQAII